MVFKWNCSYSLKREEENLKCFQQQSITSLPHLCGECLAASGQDELEPVLFGLDFNTVHIFIPGANLCLCDTDYCLYGPRPRQTPLQRPADYCSPEATAYQTWEICAQCLKRSPKLYFSVVVIGDALHAFVEGLLLCDTDSMAVGPLLRNDAQLLVDEMPVDLWRASLRAIPWLGKRQKKKARFKS